jgi:hypothetical protein
LTTPVVKLTPAGPDDPSVAEHAAHEGGAAPAAAAPDDAENQFFADTVKQAQRGPSIWSIGGWVIAGLAVLAGVVMMLRNRHRATDDDDDQDEDETPAASSDESGPDEKEPVSAGKWSLKG